MGWWRGRIQFVLPVCLSTFKVPTVSPYLHPRTRTGGRSRERLIFLPDYPGKRSSVVPCLSFLLGSCRVRAAPGGYPGDGEPGGR